MDQDSAGIRFAPPLAYLGVLVAGLVLGRAFGDRGLPLSGHFERAMGAAIAVIGIGIVLTAANLFRAAGTDPKPWKAATSLVTDRVYRWTRNPMYLGMAVIYAGIALWFDSLVALLLLAPLLYYIQQEVILREERYLEARFGEPYRAYKASVRRWL
ncbi:MAG: isoprenylcysteine carboxylmethyltransferase family protein [Sphingomonas sp.]